jgi:hypothetical protein
VKVVRVLMLLFSLFLASCGGGSSSPAPVAAPPPPMPTAQDLSSAQQAKLSAGWDATTQMVSLSWSDTFSAGTTYQIQQQATADTWTVLDSIPGMTGSGSPLTWTHNMNVTSTLRVAADRTGYQVPLDTPSGSTSVQITVPPTPPTIILDQPQPVSGTVNVSIGGGGTYSSVSYYVDLNLLGSSTAAPHYGIALDTSTLTAGPHLLLARLLTSPDSYLEIRLTFQVATQDKTAVGISVLGTSGTVYVNVSATSSFNITSVTATLDGKSIGTLAAPNACSYGADFCSFGGNVYQFPVNATAAGSGPHTVTAQATDGNGVVTSSSVTVTFNNPPVLNLTSPFDGVLVTGTLPITGTFSSDKPTATFSLNVTLGSLPVLSTTTSPFSTSFSLAGVQPGTYTLTATVTDNSGESTVITDLVTVTSAGLAYPPVLTLGKSTSLLSVGGQNVLYSDSYGVVHLHTTAEDEVLPLGSIQNLIDWTVTDGGYVFASGMGHDRGNGNYSVYMWAPGSSEAANLSLLVNSTAIYDQLLTVHYPWVLWSSFHAAWDGYVFYNVSTGQQVDVAAPAGATSVGNDNSDFFQSNGQLTLFYWAEFAGTTGANAYNVMRWDQSTGASVALTNDGVSLYPQTDGVRVAWQSPPLQLPYSLTTRDLASNTTTVLSTDMTVFQLANGLLGWRDGTGIRASVGTTTSTISTLQGTSFVGSSGGYVVFEENTKLYAWSPAGGRQLLFEAAPGQVHLTGKTVYFTNGNQQVLYAVTLP